MWKNALPFVVVPVLGISVWTLAGSHFGFQAPAYRVGFALAFALALVIIFRLGARAGLTPKIAAGLFMFGVLIVPSLLLGGIVPAGASTPFGTPLGFTVVSALAVALVLSGLLLYAGTSDRQAIPTAGPSTHQDLMSRPALITAALLLGVTFHTLYWLMIWDSSYDPIGVIWLIPLVLIALLLGIALVIVPARRSKIAGVLFAFLLPACLIAITATAHNVGFRALTEARAERVSRALETYHDRHGRYPENLRQLLPRNLLFLPTPTVLFGQSWCYDSGDDFYRLGFVDRSHWSDPRLIGRVFATGGQAPDQPSLCAPEIRSLTDRYPDLFVKIEE